MTIAYSAPPAQPELYSSSPFYGYRHCHVQFTGPKGLGREVVHNSVPRRYPGRIATCFGEDPKIVANAFPYAPRSDNTNTGYALRFSGGSKALAYPMGGFQNASALSNAFGVVGTMWAVFKIEEMNGYSGAMSILCSSSPSPLSNQGVPYASTSGAPYGSVPDMSLVVGTNGSGTVGFGFGDGNGFVKSYYICNQAPILKGEWYFGAVSWYNGTDTFNGSIVQPRRVYLHRLSTDTRICGTADTTAQTYANGFGSPAAPAGANRGYIGSLNSFPAIAHQDFIVNPGPDPSTATSGSPLIGQIHMAGCDRIFWDNSGQFAAIPAEFSGVDPFTYMLNDIYEAGRGTYATGSGGTTLVNTSSQNHTNGNVLSSIGQGKLAGAFSTINNVVAGVPATQGLVFLGDCAVVGLSDTQAVIMASRPQAAAGAMTQYSLYRSTTGGFTPDVGSFVATQTVASDPYAHIFVNDLTDDGYYYYKIVASDGTNTYTYPQVQATRRSRPAQFIMLAGNSYETSTGGSPWIGMGRQAQIKNYDLNMIVLGFDGSALADWTVATATRATPFETATYNPLSFLNAHIAREAAARGKAVDAVFNWLVENNIATSPASFNSSMTTIANASLGANLARYCPIMFAPRLLAGNNPPGGLGEAISLNLQSMDNGTTILVLGLKWMQYGTSDCWAQQGAHPSIFQAMIEGGILVDDYTNRLYPASGSAVFLGRGSMDGGF